MKTLLNRCLRAFGAEIHGLGYLEKLSRTTFKNDAYAVQRSYFNADSNLTVIDGGANHGFVTERYLQLFPGSTVFAFEPTPDVFQSLQRRFGSHPRVKSFELGLFDHEGELAFHVNHSTDTNSILKSTKIGGRSDTACATVDAVTIRTTTIDLFAQREQLHQIDILKLDIQGAEKAALEGASGMLQSGAIKLIFAETYFKPQYEQQPLFWDIAHLLHFNGYTFVDLYDPYYDTNQLLWCDCIFVHNSILS